MNLLEIIQSAAAICKLYIGSVEDLEPEIIMNLLKNI